MEICIRTALWMFFLIGYLQGVPLTKTPAPVKEQVAETTCTWDSISRDVLFEQLKNEKVNASLNFTSPSIHNNFQTVKAKEAALLWYKQGFEEAKKNCINPSYISETLDAINNGCNKSTTAYTNETIITKYQGFVNNFESFLQLLKN